MDFHEEIPNSEDRNYLSNQLPQYNDAPSIFNQPDSTRTRSNPQQELSEDTLNTDAR